MTLRAKWTFAVLAVALVPLVVLGTLVLDIQRRGLERAEQELEAAIVDEAAGAMMSALDQASDLASRAASVVTNDQLSADARTRQLEDLVARSPTTSGMAFFDENRGFIDALLPTATTGDEGDRATELRLAPTLAPDRSSGFEARGNVLRWQIRLEKPPRGFIVVGLSRAALTAKMADLSQVRFGAKDRVYVVDESLRVILGGGEGRHFETPAIFESAKGASPNRFATELLLTTEFTDHGISKVGTIRTMPAQRWALVVERPTDEAFAALGSARRAFLTSLAGFAALAALAGVLVARRTLGPIAALMRLVERYARRELEARSDVKSGDELEALGRSLERMADGLAASEEEIAKRARLEENLKRYIPKEAATAAALGSLDLGGAKKRVTVLFADVVSFTSFAEKTSPDRAVAFLNELFTILSEIVFRHDGMVDKFIGDCVMAVFRADESGEDDAAARALASAEDMHAFVASNLPRWREAYAFDVDLGIGVATGEVLVGNLGSSERMEYTVIGDAVNVAARLELLAGPRKTLTTREVVDACPDMAFSSLGTHALRGKSQPIEVFEVTT
jgi:adenylate cyclase